MNRTEVDIPSSGVEAATEDYETEALQADTSEETEIPSSQDQETQQQDEQAKPEEPAAPFANGKERFKVNGQEYEWDWETTKRYAQLGRSGQLAMERAAQVEKKAKDAYQELLRAAQHDPEGLIKILNPTWQGFQPRGAKAQQHGDVEAQADQGDPRDAVIEELRREVQTLKGSVEDREIAEERNRVETEITDAVKQFPILDNPIYRDHIKTQYARHLRNGIENITIEDVAFHVAQQIQELRQAEEKQRKTKIEEKRRKAPVSGVPGDSEPSEPGGLEYAKKLAGRI